MSVSPVVILTVQVAALATVLVTPLATAVAYLLARHQFPGKSVVSTLVALPLVLPPTAVGYVLLHAFSDDALFGAALGLEILFTAKAAVLAAMAMAFPLIVRTARLSFEAVDPGLVQVAETLGDSPRQVFWRVTFPLAKRGLVAAMILGFMRGVGEFGATVMIARNIPGKTRTLASAIYSAQQVGDDATAWVLLGLAVGVGFVAISTSEWLIGGRPV